MAPSTPITVDGIDLSDPEFWTSNDRAGREAAFTRLRDACPVSFHRERVVEGSPFPVGPGYWALTKHHDIKEASRRPKLFCSGHGSNIPDLPMELNEFFGSMINMDDPKHARLRLLVQAGFTPKMVKQVEGYVRAKARDLVDIVVEKGDCDFVSEIAALLPLEVICDMMGIPTSDRRRMFELTNSILGAGDPEFGGTLESFMAAAMELYQYAISLGQTRLDRPTDDITSAIINAEVDGERLTTQEFASFFILLVVAGNETTRNAISHGMKALTDFPEQRAIWLADFDAVAPTAVEEIVRWASPVIHFRRTATEDTVIRGTEIAAGDKVVFFYNSANRDEEVFRDPYTFDVRRSPNDHLGYGAGGPHFCLGANLARREIAVMFDELLHRIPDLHISGEPEYLQSNFINGIKRMPCSFSRTAPARVTVS